MAQLTPMGLVKIMGLVTLIMVVPILGGAVAGLVMDELMEMSPLFVLSGVVVGTLIAAIGIWLLIRAGARRGLTDGRPSDPDPGVDDESTRQQDDAAASGSRWTWACGWEYR